MQNFTFTKLGQYLFDAVGKSQEELAKDNPYRDIGFDGGKKRLGWLSNISFASIKDTLTGIKEILEDKEYFIFVGIGGSANGIKALAALFNNKTIYVLDSLDPQALLEVVGKIKNKNKLLVVPISKSGTTGETQALAGALKEIFPKDNWAKNFLWFADPEAFAKLDALGWKDVKKVAIQFNQESDIGGRFSCPGSMIFYLPLYLLLNKDILKVEKNYNQYVKLKNAIECKAYFYANKYSDKKNAYFSPVINKKIHSSFQPWVVQLFQESLGSKNQTLEVKTVFNQSPKDKVFSPVKLGLKIDNKVVAIMAEMYFLQVFVAFYAAFKQINFVSQDFVEKYKAQMRELQGKTIEDVAAYDLKEIISQVSKKTSSRHKFIEIVLYFYPDGALMNKIKREFQRKFPAKIISVFIGSDWNHHSYQAAFGDKNTLYVLLLASSYKTQATQVSELTLSNNISLLKLITKATYLTLEDKAVVTSILR